MKIAVYCIAKNESQFVDRFMDNFKHDDVQVYVLDTGSEDDTVQRFLDRGANVNLMTVPFRFDHARNQALSHVPNDVDVCLSMDIDEVIEQGFCAKIAETFADPDVAGASLDFIFSRDHAQEPAVRYQRVLMHRRSAGHWKYPVHEVLEIQGRVVETSIVSEHLPDNGKARDYLPLLVKKCEEHPEDPRSWHYLGREYMYLNKLGLAVQILDRCLEVSGEDEAYVFDTLVYLGQCYSALNDFYEAENSYRQAVAVDPWRREGLMYLAQFYFDRDMVEEALGHTIRALRIKDRVPGIYTNESCYNQWPYHLAATCYHRMGAQDLAVQYIEWAAEAAPKDGHVMADYATITKRMPPGVV